MFKNMTIKIKLVLSFTLIVLLIAILSLYSIYSVGKSSDGFTSYREMAKDSVLAGRVQANMLMVRMNVKDFLKTPVQKEIDEFEDYYKKTDGFVKEALLEIQKPSRAPMVKDISEKLVAYKGYFYEVVEFYKKRNDIVNNNLDVNGKKIEQLLTAVMKSAKKDNDLEASLTTAQTIRTLLLARLYTSKYLASNSPEHASRVDKEFTDLQSELKKLREEIQNPTRREQLAQAVTLIDKYKNGVKSIVSIIRDRNFIIDGKLNKIGPQIAKISEDVKLSIKKDQDTIGPAVAELNDNIQSLITTISIVILVIAIAMAIFLPKDIIRLLTTFQAGLLDFFKYLNKETDSVKPINLNGKNEIITMAGVVNENIVKTQALMDQDITLIDDVKRVVNEVGQGRLTQRIEKNTDNEGLQELKKIFNEMLDITSKNVCEDVNKLNRVLDSFAKLDFTDRVDNDSGNVSKGINNLADIINQMLLENKENGLTLDNSSDILLKNVDMLNNASNEAAASLEETAAALEEMTSTIISNTENVVKMSSFASQVTNSANEGEKLAQDTTVSMDEINEQVKAISEAISVIDQIAFQTNILSLNAAVEAATAGEAGKGFAVVAGEVRNLAARSAEAANEIKTLVENATAKANSGKAIADKMIQGYNGLNENITKTIDIIKDIEFASKEQQTGISQINDAITDLDQQTQTNASIANQTKDIAVQTDEIAKLVVLSADEKEFDGKDSVKAKNITTTASQTTQKPLVSSKDVVKKETKSQENEKSSADEWESF